MDKNCRPQERDIFRKAQSIADASRRAIYLDTVCGTDVALRSRVESLLIAFDQAGAFLESPAIGFLESASATEVSESAGETIGPYKLLEQIGEGGFGVVYMAKQEAPIQRDVALKIIKPGMDTKEVIGRFETERQAIALMDHPNIAKVFDAGSTESGRPYFVMELVRGTPIIDFCDDNRLTIHERLELFISVCHAIQHAHQKAIIHRDIKPSNVLVTMHDDKPVPKVIDFGIAKAVNTALTTKTAFTQFHKMIGTPMYMSPEQAQMSGSDVDTRADVYALGVLLYEMLTGATPFDPEALLRGTYDDICRLIREQDPPRPSNRVSTMDGRKRLTAASARQSVPNRLVRLLRGELEWILIKALEKDRTRRYQTARDFAEDVRRYLSQEPVLAGPPTFRYRASKFVRRHKQQVVVATAFLMLLCLSSIVASILYLDANIARDNVTKALAVAEERREQADGAASALQTQLGIANARLLAARAHAIRFDSPVKGVLLSAEAVRMSEHYDHDTRSLAFESLVSALGVLGGEPLIEGNAAISCTQTDSTGIWLAIGRYDGSLSVCKMAKGSPTQSVTMSAHGKKIEGIAFSPDGTLFTASRDGWIKGWTLREGRDPALAVEIPCKDIVYSLAISPDGSFIAAAVAKQIRIWNLVDDSANPVTIVTDLETKSHSLRFTADGSQVVTKEGHTSSNSSMTIRVWDVKTGEETKRLVAHTDWITQFVVSNDGRWIASTSWDGTVRVWNLVGSEATVVADITLVKTDRSFNTVAFSADSRWLAAGGDDDFVRLWDLHAGDPQSSQQILDGHSGAITTLKFTSDGQRLISGSDDTTARIWDLHVRGVPQLLAVLRGHNIGLDTLEIDPKNEWVVTGDKRGNIRRWEIGQQVVSSAHPVSPISSGSVADPYYTIRVAFSKDDRWLAAGDLRGGIRIWSMDSLDAEPKDLRAHTEGVFSLAFDPQNRYLLSGSFDGTIRKWDLNSMDSQSTKFIDLGDRKKVWSIVIDAISECVFVTEREGAISVWCHESSQAVFVDEIHVGGFRPRLAVDPDGKKFYTGNASGELREWRRTSNSIESGRQISELEDAITSIAVDDLGQLLAAGSSAGKVFLYDIGDDEVTQIAEMAAHFKIESLVFSADGKWLFAGADRALHRWNIDQPNLRPLVMRGHRFESIDITRDGTRLVSSGHGAESPRLWFLNPEDLLEIARRTTGRRLTAEELQRFSVVAPQN